MACFSAVSEFRSLETETGGTTDTAASAAGCDEDWATSEMAGSGNSWSTVRLAKLQPWARARLVTIDLCPNRS